MMQQMMMAQQMKQQDVTNQQSQMRLQKEGLQLQDMKMTVQLDNLLGNQIVNHVIGTAV